MGVYFMKSIAVWVQKGGTSKSTTVGGLCDVLRKGSNVLAIDADPQANLTAWLHPKPFNHELADVVSGTVDLATATVNIRPSLDLLPTFAIGGYLKEWAETSLMTKHPYAFQDLADTARAAGYQYLIYDMGPGASALERSILASVDECLPVIRPEAFSVDGLETFEATLSDIRKHLRARVTAPRLVVGCLNRSFGIHQGYIQALEGLAYQLFTIGQSTKIPEAQGLHCFLSEHDSSNKALSEYSRLGEAIA
jgi:cellulose biosynthesis protein BcsQ